MARRRLALLIVGAWLATRSALADVPADHQAAADIYDYVEGADRLEGRLLAPCCWNQTLDIHGSEISNQLRKEIRTRLKAGDAPDRIEADIVARYGDKILAVPPQSPLKGFAIGLSFAFGGAGVAAAFMLTRWRRRTRQQQEQEAKQEKPTGPDEWDEKLEDELERLEG